MVSVVFKNASDNAFLSSQSTLLRRFAQNANQHQKIEDWMGYMNNVYFVRVSALCIRRARCSKRKSLRASSNQCSAKIFSVRWKHSEPPFIPKKRVFRTLIFGAISLDMDRTSFFENFLPGINMSCDPRSIISFHHKADL